MSSLKKRYEEMRQTCLTPEAALAELEKLLQFTQFAGRHIDTAEVCDILSRVIPVLREPWIDDRSGVGIPCVCNPHGWVSPFRAFEAVGTKH